MDTIWYDIETWESELMAWFRKSSGGTQGCATRRTEHKDYATMQHQLV